MEIQKTNLAQVKTKNADSVYFTGKTVMKEITSKIKSNDEKLYHVTFKNGSRTKLHYHTGGQTLIVTEGIGSLEIFKKNTKTKNSLFEIKLIKTTSLKKGDIAYIPAKTLHTHGSVSKKTFSHFAINAYMPSKKEPKTIWFESDFNSKVIKKL
ncbi:cupin [Nitrosopumilus sp. b1]|uniref:cupin n=1 Tax=Nitrosopumilus sp. b1 TaxID=2109907 RepID=UPI003183CCDC